MSRLIVDTLLGRDQFRIFWEFDGDVGGHLCQDMADESEATAALRIARAALKHERPLPEWAKTAIANGWKPPKGWKP